MLRSMNSRLAGTDAQAQSMQSTFADSADRLARIDEPLAEVKDLVIQLLSHRNTD